MPAHDVIRKAVDKLVKSDAKLAARIANEVFTELDNNGWLTTDNDHLAMMRATLTRIHNAVTDPDCSTRDLASLTRRLQEFSREVTTLEERQRQEKSSGGNKNTGKANGASQPLNI